MSRENRKRVLGVIPARIGSKRIPEKMLADICGKTLIQRTVERTQGAKLLDHFYVSTDSDDVASSVRELGIEARVEIFNEANGTERVIKSAANFADFKPDILVNIWGDEPLYPAAAIDGCVAELMEDDSLPVALAGDRITDRTLLDEPSIVQVLTDLKNNVIFFTRANAPYQYTDISYDHYHVIGVMAMRQSFASKFLELPQTPIETIEGVEQMRILEHGYRMRLVKGEFNNLGVNTPDELEVVRNIFQSKLQE